MPADSGSGQATALPALWCGPLACWCGAGVSPATRSPAAGTAAPHRNSGPGPVAPTGSRLYRGLSACGPAGCQGQHGRGGEKLKRVKSAWGKQVPPHTSTLVPAFLGSQFSSYNLRPSPRSPAGSRRHGRLGSLPCAAGQVARSPRTAMSPRRRHPRFLPSRVPNSPPSAFGLRTSDFGLLPHRWQAALSKSLATALIQEGRFGLRGTGRGRRCEPSAPRPFPGTTP